MGSENQTTAKSYDMNSVRKEKCQVNYLKSRPPEEPKLSVSEIKTLLTRYHAYAEWEVVEIVESKKPINKENEP